MTTNEAHDGLPTRAIHEAYLTMQRSLKQYDQAVDAGDNRAIEQAHGDVQTAVLTTFRMLRPHIRSETAVAEYWDGEPPGYGRGRVEPIADGTAVLAVHEDSRVQSLNGNKANGDLPDTSDLRAWHEFLNLNQDQRVTAVNREGLILGAQLQVYRTGLKHLDEWRTEFTTSTSERHGFYRERETTVSRQRVPETKLRRAARELAEVANTLGALSDFDASSRTTEITDDQIERLEKWRQQNVEQ